jgi:FkbM family methyltransferase
MVYLPDAIDMSNKPVVTSPPWHFRLAKWMMRKNVPGGHRLINTTSNLGLLNVTARYSLNDRITIDVPLYRESNRWDRQDVWEYDIPTVERLSNAIESLPEPVVFIDCGADIGIMSILVATETSNIERFIGFEPNKKAYDVLTENYRRLPYKAEAVFGAVGRFSGKGELESPDYYPDVDHAKFITVKGDGSIPIYRIDDLPIERNKCVALKIDVEGAELDTIEGAAETLSNAKQFVVDVEAHPKVAQRTGIDPILFLRRLNDIKPCKYYICERPDVNLILDQNFFDQVKKVNHDVVVVSE